MAICGLTTGTLVAVEMKGESIVTEDDTGWGEDTDGSMPRPT
jgi:hypothetical protein